MPHRILDAAEEMLRRHGVQKTNVVDVARALGMSHGNIYRHFPSKQALLDAVDASAGTHRQRLRSPGPGAVDGVVRHPADSQTPQGAG